MNFKTITLQNQITSNIFDKLQREVTYKSPDKYPNLTEPTSVPTRNFYKFTKTLESKVISRCFCEVQ